MAIELLAALAAGGAILLAGLAMMRRRQLQPADRRIQRLADAPKPPRRGISWEDVRRRGPSTLPVLRNILTDSAWAERTQTEIDQSGIKLRVGEYLIARIILAIVPMVLITLVGRTLIALVIGISVGVLGFYLPKIWLSVIRKRRVERVAKQLPEAVAMIANALRAGFAFQHGLDMVAKQMDPPIADEFTRVTVDLNVGASVEEAMNSLLERSNSEDMNIMVTAVLVQRTSGGNLAEILETVAETMRERERLLGEVKTLTSQQRFSGTVLTFWPLLILGLFSLLSWESMNVLFTTSIGQALLVVMVIGQLLGFFTIRRILDVDI